MGLAWAWALVFPSSPRGEGTRGPSYNHVGVVLTIVKPRGEGKAHVRLGVGVGLAWAWALAFPSSPRGEGKAHVRLGVGVGVAWAWRGRGPWPSLQAHVVKAHVGVVLTIVKPRGEGARGRGVDDRQATW